MHVGDSKCSKNDPRCRMVARKRRTLLPNGFRSHHDTPEGMKDAPENISERPKELHALRKTYGTLLQHLLFSLSYRF